MSKLLLAILLSLAGAAAFAQEPRTSGTPAAPAPSPRTMQLLRAAEDSVFFLAGTEQLGLTRSQRTALYGIVYEFQKAQLQRVADMNVVEAELDRLLTREPIDVDAVKRKIEESAAIGAGMKILLVESLLRAVNVLTPEQQLKALGLGGTWADPANASGTR